MKAMIGDANVVEALPLSMVNTYMYRVDLCYVAFNRQGLRIARDWPQGERRLQAMLFRLNRHGIGMLDVPARGEPHG